MWFEVGWNFLINDENPTWWHLGRILQTKNTRVWESQDRIGIVWPGDSSEEIRTWLSQIENYGKKEVSSKIYEIRILAPEMENLRETPWSRIREQKHRVQRILWDCWQWETNGQCVKGNNCSFRHDINKRGKMTQPNTSPNSFMQQSERKPSRTRSPQR